MKIKLQFNLKKNYKLLLNNSQIHNLLFLNKYFDTFIYS